MPLHLDDSGPDTPLTDRAIALRSRAERPIRDMQTQPAEVQLLRKSRLERAPGANLPPEPSDDELVYEQANDMLWSPGSR
jgi:hypothetical protein